MSTKDVCTTPGEGRQQESGFLQKLLRPLAHDLVVSKILEDRVQAYVFHYKHKGKTLHTAKRKLKDELKKLLPSSDAAHAFDLIEGMRIMAMEYRFANLPELENWLQIHKEAFGKRLLDEDPTPISPSKNKLFIKKIKR
jgi:hypothetical protein